MLGTDFKNCQGEDYDTWLLGKGMETSISENPDTFFVSCCTRSLNLLLGGMISTDNNDILWNISKIMYYIILICLKMRHLNRRYKI